ncbi:protein-disulfide reductase DsbD [Aliiglaciecola lipolytica]|uniref:Thiol:disulfide interchange protein DsbD n=1 Tax=Aliiglaciecola lipolytica E3 TaxID=1127673 RepID=K6YYU2_9ALTE|nr:protein-disulfide reductase DsbD [Aliiglaciecola lipolytica]GAC16375.1 thiol:disulfide interchange protein DsbD [Aliiglaciecola lipolytica E3]
MKFKHLILVAVLVLFPWASIAQSNQAFEDLFADEPEFLPVEQAFQFDFDQQGEQLILRFTIAEGYYLYQNQFKTVVKNAEISQPVYPEAKIKEDEFFDEPQPVFYDQVDINYTVEWSEKDAVVKLQYQGCADAGLCYPPTVQVVYLDQVGGARDASSETQISQNSSANKSDDELPVSQQFELADLLKGEQLLILKLAIFLLLGVGLAFTPCVFPMYPILSSIVIGQGKSISTSKAFSLSFMFVQGMAITYSILGLVIASAGAQFTAYLQNPYILGVLIVIFVALAFVMFGAYELQLPSKWQEKLNGLSNKQKSGSFIGAFVMGVIAGLVASPCTTAPLTGILLFIAEQGDQVLGFFALYALSLGMGIPLIVFGVTGGKLLPKAGNWMNIVKVAFGFMMLVVALTFLERLVTKIWIEYLWSALGLATFTYFYVMNQNSPATLWKGVRSLVIFIGLFGSILYGYHQFNQSRSSAQYSVNNSIDSQQSIHHQFVLVKNLRDFESKLKAANAEGKTVMVDLYADWCVACKEFEKYTFPDPAVQSALSNTVWMQIDLTDNTAVNIEFQKAFDVLGLPTIMFFDTQGNELSSARVTGFMKAAPFAKHVNQALN